MKKNLQKTLFFIKKNQFLVRKEDQIKAEESITYTYLSLSK